MTDIILAIRLGIDDNRKNTKHILNFAGWLNQKYGYYAQKFLQEILSAAQIPFEGLITTKPSYSFEDDIFEEYRHPKKEKGGKWILDDLPMKNEHPVWIKLDNQWLKGIIEVKGKEKHIIIEPESVIIPITEKLFLKW